MKGEEDAFEILMQETVPATYRFIRGLGATTDEAEDVLQDTYIKAWKAFDRYDSEKPIRPWLFQIAKRTYFDSARRKSAIPFTDALNASDATYVAETLADPEPLPDELFATEERRQSVQTALSTLSLPEQIVLSLRYDEGFSFDDIAETLEKPASTIRSIHRRALARLKTTLSPDATN